MDQQAFTAPGEMVTVNGSSYHVCRYGEHGPAIILECGLTMMSACWGWIAGELARFSRVITYDRAGLGWSSERSEVRDARQIASELQALLGAMGLEEPPVLLGHSMGAIYSRCFVRLGARVRSLVWLDPAHPEQIRKRGIRRRMRNLVFYIEAAQLLAARGVPAIEVPLVKHLDGLPAQEFRRLRRFLRNPTHLRTSAREARAWESSIELLAEQELGALPLLMISGRKNALPGWELLQAELAALSLAAQHHTFPEMSHLSMLAQKEHAAKIADAIHEFLREKEML